MEQVIIHPMCKCKEFNCDICEDKGYYEKTEWTGTDTSYEVEKKCICQED